MGMGARLPCVSYLKGAKAEQTKAGFCEKDEGLLQKMGQPPR